MAVTGGSSASRASRTAERGDWRRGTGRRCPATAAGRRPPTGPTRWGCSRSRIAPGSLTWCRCGMGGCWCRRSPSTGGRPRSWPPTWHGTPTAGLQVQLCGDAHLSNFGLFASPERELLFGLNDFDETLPGPFEYDVKRLAASFTIAGRNNGFGKVDTRAVTLASVAAYREAMAGFAEMGRLEVWYAHLNEEELLQAMRRAAKAAKTKKQTKAARRAEKNAEKAVAKARTRDSLQALSKLGELVDGRYRIVSQPPIVVPMRDLEATYGLSADEIERVLHDQFRAYRATLQRRSPPAAGAVRGGRHGPQGGGGGQRRHPGVHRPAPGPRPARSAVLAGQGGDQVGPGGPAAQEPLQRARRAGGVRPAAAAGRQRHLPGLDQGAWTPTATSTGASCAT